MTASNVTLSAERRGSRLAVTDAFGHDWVKLRLSRPPGYPGALLAAMEGPGPVLQAGAAPCFAPFAASDIEQIDRRYGQRDNEGR